MPVSFADTRMVTYPIDCVLNGQDPYDRSACHPLGSVYNYPPIWLDLRYLGVTSRSSFAMGAILVAMYVSALLLLFTSRRWVSFAVVLAGVLSRPSLFAVERGNIDLAIFSLLVFGLFLGARRKPRARTFSDGLLVVLLTILKVYPVAAVAAFIRNRKGLRTASVVAALAIAGLLITSGRSLARVLGNTPQFATGSYGAFPFFSVISLYTFHSLTPILENHHWIASLAGLLMAVLATLAAAANRDKFDRLVPRLDFESARGQIAIACLAIYCFTFLAGAAFTYRLIFLLGVLAFLVDALNKSTSLRFLPACLGLLAFLWVPIARFSLLLQLLDGLVFFVASAWLGSTLLSRLGLSQSDEPTPSSARAAPLREPAT